MNSQRAFSDMTDEELRQIIIDVKNDRARNETIYSNLEGAILELSKRGCSQGSKGAR